MKREMWMALGILMVSLGMAAPADAGIFGGPEIPGEFIYDVPEADTYLSVKDLGTDAAFEAALADLPGSGGLPISPILQYPELPTGCESVSLTMALDALGLSLDKTTIVDSYLIYDEDNMAAGYNGDPYSEDGAGVFPPGIVMTANSFLTTQDTSIRAYEATGVTFQKILAYVATGSPVLMWVTMEYDEPWWSEDYYDYGVIVYQWYWNEHCVVIKGYDLEDETITICDPLQGEIVMNLYDIKELYNEIGRLAVVLR